MELVCTYPAVHGSMASSSSSSNDSAMTGNTTLHVSSIQHSGAYGCITDAHLHQTHPVTDHSPHKLPLLILPLYYYYCNFWTRKRVLNGYKRCYCCREMLLPDFQFPKTFSFRKQLKLSFGYRLLTIFSTIVR